jgi:hypothetical protein
MLDIDAACNSSFSSAPFPSISRELTDTFRADFHSHKLRKPKQPLTHQLNRSRGNNLEFGESSPKGLARTPSRSTIGGGQISPVYPIGITRSLDSRLEVSNNSFGELGKDEEVIIESCKCVLALLPPPSFLRPFLSSPRWLY